MATCGVFSNFPGRAGAMLRGIVGLALAVYVTTTAAAGPLDPFFGRWQTPDGGEVLIKTCSKTPCGQLVSFPPPPGTTMATATDVNNRDQSKRGRKLLGLAVLWRMEPAGKGAKARIYDPRRGFSVPATLTLQGNRLTIRGCARVIFEICETETWVRR